MTDPTEIVSFCVSDATGRILRSGQCPRSMIALQAVGDQIAHEAAGTSATHWWDGSAIVQRAALSGFDRTSVPANGSALASVVGLPNPTHVSISGVSEDIFDVTDGHLELSFDTAGAYRVRLDAGVSYLVTEVTIDAT